MKRAIIGRCGRLVRTSEFEKRSGFLIDCPTRKLKLQTGSHPQPDIQAEVMEFCATCNPEKKQPIYTCADCLHSYPSDDPYSLIICCGENYSKSFRHCDFWDNKDLLVVASNPESKEDSALLDVKEGRIKSFKNTDDLFKDLDAELKK